MTFAQGRVGDNSPWRPSSRPRTPRLGSRGGDGVVRFPTSDTQPARPLRRQQASFDELLARSRVLSLHARVTDETTGMISREQTAALPRGSVLVNCARGALLDYEAVYDALDSGGNSPKPASTSFPGESLPPDPLLPHTSPEEADRSPTRHRPSPPPRSAAICAENPSPTTRTRTSCKPRGRAGGTEPRPAPMGRGPIQQSREDVVLHATR
ncbi:NAD(P)-dependent oxidoreductase [Streptomyces luteireticuli]|uniref:NAD(P)-dependent oxidoreductase n=1 Tax=Streptomyces luteireticuli TaxID=173858 RepID=UPI003557957A